MRASRRRQDRSAGRQECVNAAPPGPRPSRADLARAAHPETALRRPAAAQRPARRDAAAQALALPVFCSDPLSSVAYATEEILLVLGLGGLSLLWLTPWLARPSSALLVIVVASYRQTCHAYPNGGGAYAVSRRNLGRARPAWSRPARCWSTTCSPSRCRWSPASPRSPRRSPRSRRTRSLLSLIASSCCSPWSTCAASRSPAARSRSRPTASSPSCCVLLAGRRRPAGARARRSPRRARTTALVAPQHTGGLLIVFLVLRAFASGCTALTGVEAVSNGVPSFREPKSRNAAGDAGDHGRAGDRHVRRHHRAGHGHPRAHGRGHRPADRAPGRAARRRRRSARSGWPCSAPSLALLPAAGLHRRDPGAGREHRVQRLPGAGLDARPATATCPASSPGAATGWCSATASSAGRARRAC